MDHPFAEMKMIYFVPWLGFWRESMTTGNMFWFFQGALLQMEGHIGSLLEDDV